MDFVRTFFDKQENSNEIRRLLFKIENISFNIFTLSVA